MAFTKEMLDKLTKLVKNKPCNIVPQPNWPYAYTVSLNNKECFSIHNEHHCGGDGNIYKVIIKFPGEKEIEIKDRFSGALYDEAMDLLNLVESIMKKREEAKKSNQLPRQEMVDERRKKQIRILNYLDGLLANQK